MQNRIMDFEEKLVDFAKKNPTIQAIHYGVDPEEGNPTYYLLRPGQCNFELEDRLGDLELDYCRSVEDAVEVPSVMVWPIPAESATQYDFIRERIYPAEN